MPSDGRQRPVRCLWLTLADPEPRYNGQYVYSGGLIDSVAEAGGDVEVLGLGRSTPAETGSQRAGHVVWWLPSDVPHSHWGSLASSLPHIAYRCRTAGMQGILDKLLKRGGWDGIVFDGISTGWALPRVLDHYAGRGDRPRLIYVSHNHEESLRTPGRPLRCSQSIAPGTRTRRRRRLRDGDHAGGPQTLPAAAL